MALTGKQHRFAVEYIEDYNATRAAERAGYSVASAHTQGSLLMQKPEVIAEIAAHEGYAAKSAGLTRAKVIALFVDLSFADPSELTCVIESACRVCWPRETRKTLKAAGLRVDPNPQCEMCDGRGIRLVELADTSKVSPAARKLFVSAKQNKDGCVEVKTEDQTPYRMALAKMVGLSPDKVEVSGPGGGPVQLQAMRDVSELSKEQLRALISANLGVQSGVSEEREPLTIEGSTA